MKYSTLLLLLCAANCGAADWPQWRGPSFNGSTDEKNLPSQWSSTNGILWQAPLPGAAASTPAVWKDTVFVTSPDAEGKLWLLNVSVASGKERWRRQVASDNKDKGRNNMSSPSPCTDGKLVFAMFATGDLVAFDFEGKQKWGRNLAREHGRLAQMWIYGSSPLLHNGRLYVPMLQRSPVPSDYTHAVDGREQRESFLLCIESATGKDLWKQVRPTGAENESMEAYTTPVPAILHGKLQILLFGANHLTSHDPETGAELWRSPDLNPKKVDWWRVVPSPVVVGRDVVVSAPRREPVFCIRPAGKGQLSSESIAWKFDEHPSDCPTPLVYDGKLFILDGDRQIMTRLDPKTGAKIWQGSLGVREVVRASPLGADGRIYCVTESGTVIVLGAGDRLEILATIPAASGAAPVRASLAAAHGRIFMRTAKNLVCIGNQ